MQRKITMRFTLTFVVAMAFALPNASWSCGQDASQALLESLAEHPEVVAFTASREALAADPYRPLYHFSAPMNGIHDPNGLCQWKGRYHLFYQYKLKERGRRVTKWGHTFSDDLIHWRDLPVAIEPTIEQNCYSGQTLVDGNRVIASYQGVGQGMMVATASDPLLTKWTKHPDNPLIPLEEPGRECRFLDSCIWKEADGYYLISGAYIRGKRGPGGKCIGQANLFRSKDLSDWKYLGPMFTDDLAFAEPGEDLQVPNFWPIGQGKHLLLCFSHKRAARGYVGSFDLNERKFTPDFHFRENHGDYRSGSIHAPSATIDDRGRYLAIFNMPETKGVVHEGWDQVMSLPRVYSLSSEQELRVSPVEEVERLRSAGVNHPATELTAGSEKLLPEIEGRSMEIHASFDLTSASSVGLKVFRSEDGEQYTEIGYVDGTLFIDTSRASDLPKLKTRRRDEVAIELQSNEPLDLRIFIDRSIVEVFANGRVTHSCRVYPTLESSNRVSVYCKDGWATLSDLKAWQMHSVWPELVSKEGE